MFLFLESARRGVFFFFLSFRVSVIVTLGALAVLAVYWVSALPHFDLESLGAEHRRRARWRKVELPEGGGSWLPFGFYGVLAALPFAVWLFLAIEQLPLAAGESSDPKKDMPKGLIYGMSTLMGSGAADHVPQLRHRFRRPGQDARRVLAAPAPASRCSMASASSTARVLRSCWRFWR